MWLFSCSLALYGLLPTLVASLALNAPPNTDGSLTLTEPSSMFQNLNASTGTNSTLIEDGILLNPKIATELRSLKVDCDESRFGNPPVASCKDALIQIPHDPATLAKDPTYSYGPRGEGAWDVNLPKRYISSERLLLSRPFLRLMLDSGWAMHYRSYSGLCTLAC